MIKQYKKLILLIVIILSIPYPSWYAVNYYAAGLADQTSLIEYGMEDDFMYCNDWRPERLDMGKKIDGYRRSFPFRLQRIEISGPVITRTTFKRRGPRRLIIKRGRPIISLSIGDWADKYNLLKTQKRLRKIQMSRILHWSSH